MMKGRTMIDLMKGDLVEAAGYISHGLVFGLAVAAAVFLFQKLVKKEISPLRLFLLGCFVTYLCVMVQVAFFSREPGSRPGEIDWRILPDWENNSYVRVFAIENILMFLPFGILAPLLSDWFRKNCLCVLSGAVLSVAVEAAQCVTERGFCQAEDVLMNTIGTAVGYSLWKLGQKLFTIMRTYVWKGEKKQ